MKLAIVSDSHNAWEHLQKAIEKAHKYGCTTLLHAGDIADLKGIVYLSQFRGEVYFVLGNNDKDTSAFEKEAKKYNNVHFSGEVFEGELSGISIYMNHFPSVVRAAAKTAQYDLCVYGHEHTFAQKQIGNTLFIKPGALVGDKDGKVGFVIYDTTLKIAQHIFLS